MALSPAVGDNLSLQTFVTFLLRCQATGVKTKRAGVGKSKCRWVSFMVAHFSHAIVTHKICSPRQMPVYTHITYCEKNHARFAYTYPILVKDGLAFHINLYLAGYRDYINTNSYPRYLCRSTYFQCL